MTASIRIPAKVAREIRSLLKERNDIYQTESHRHAINELDAALKPKRSVVASRVRRKAKKAETRSEWEQIRGAVLMRASGHCESCGLPSGSLDPDHMFGRGGGRKSLESVFTVWALCFQCHRQMKTLNNPSAEHWLIKFIEHCARQAGGFGDMAEDEPNGYKHAADIAKAKLESLELQAQIPDWNASPKGAKAFKRDLEVGGCRDAELRSAINRVTAASMRETRKK